MNYIYNEKTIHSHNKIKNLIKEKEILIKKKLIKLSNNTNY